MDNQTVDRLHVGSRKDCLAEIGIPRAGGRKVRVTVDGIGSFRKGNRYHDGGSLDTDQTRQARFDPVNCAGMGCDRRNLTVWSRIVGRTYCQGCAAEPEKQAHNRKPRERKAQAPVKRRADPAQLRAATVARYVSELRKLPHSWIPQALKKVPKAYRSLVNGELVRTYAQEAAAMPTADVQLFIVNHVPDEMWAAVIAAGQAA